MIISLTNYIEFIAPGNVAVALLLGVLNLTITILYNVYLFAVLLYPFVAEDNKDKTLWESLKYCMKRTNGYKWKLFCLNFSFFGWVLLAILSFGIGLIWLLPYMIGSFVLFYEDMNKELDSGKTVNPTPTAQNSRNGETSFVYKSAVKREQADGSATPQETAEPTVSQPLNEEQRTERVKKETEDFLEYLKQKNIIVNDGKDSEN